MDSAKTLQSIDRLVSASSPSDALESLSALTKSIGDYDHDNNDDRETLHSNLSILSESKEFMTALCSLLSESSISSNVTGGQMTVDDGDSTACQFITQVLSSLQLNVNTDANANTNTNANAPKLMHNRQSTAQLKKFLLQPSDGALTHALLDILSPGMDNNSANNNGSIGNSSSLYAKTQALQLIAQLTNILPTLLHSQILSAPDGLHRILDLLDMNNNNNVTIEESIRNEAILLCTTLARTNAASARLMIFGEAYEKVFAIARSEMDNSVIVSDCLNLAVAMTRQDSMGAEVFLGSSELIQTLGQMLDLRSGVNFKNPPPPEVDIVDDEDDLDDILGGGAGTSSSSNGENLNKEKKEKPAKVPFLIENEASVTLLALELLKVLIVGDGDDNGSSDNDDASKAKKQSRQRSILSHDILSRLLIDMGLYTLPPSDSPINYYISAVPTLEVQLAALDLMASLALDCGEELQELILSKRGLYLNAGVLDRLMYLVCTGDGANRPTSNAADEISMHSLGVLRCLLSAKEASIMIMHTLAPPPPADPAAPADIPMEPPVVQKLVNTLVENLHVLLDPEIAKNFKEGDMGRINRMVIGAAGAIGIFLTNGAGDTTREMLLRVPVPPPPKPMEEGEPQKQSESFVEPIPLTECMLMFLEMCSNDKNFMKKSSDVAAALLRLLSEWVPSTPKVISQILSSASSISLGVLVQQKYDKSEPPTIQAMTAILLGLCMTSMKSDDEIGGWSINSIMNLINVSLGIGKFTQLLEGLKVFMTRNVDAKGASAGPWACCNAERTRLLDWYSSSVNTVRKKAIEELTLSEGANDSDSEDGGDGDESSSRDFKAMRKLVMQQTFEIDSLREKLNELEITSSTKTNEVKSLKKRLESNPSQLDDMLNEYSSKISELEVQNRNLVAEKSKEINELQDTIQAKESLCAQLQTDLKQKEEETDELNLDIGNMKDEMVGLSTAYANLEVEYNTLASDNGVTGESNGHTANGEGVMPMSSYQIIKDENAKLKKDMHAANDWMKKAQKKISDMGQRNTSLTTELQSMKDMNANQASGTETQLATMNATLVSTQDELSNVSLQRDQLQSVIEVMKDDLSSAQSTIDRLQEQPKPVVPESSNEVNSLMARNNELVEELASERKSNSDKLTELQSALFSKDSLISELQDQIQDLKEEQNAMPSQVIGDDGSSEKLQNEIKKLTAANKSAQDWMANAVKHNNNLKKQLEDSKQECIRLSSDVEKLHTVSVENDCSQNSSNELVKERDEALKRAVDLEVKISELSISNEKMKNLIGDSDSLKNELKERVRDVENMAAKITTLERDHANKRLELDEEKEKMTAALSAKESECELLKQEIAENKINLDTNASENQEQYAIVAKLQEEIDMLKEENESLSLQRDDHTAVIEDMRNRLTEFQSWTETAQQRISELEGEKEVVEEKLAELEEMERSTKAQHDEAELKLQNSKDEFMALQQTMSSDKSELDLLRADLTIAQDRVAELEAENERNNTLQSDLQQYQHEIEQLKLASTTGETELQRLRSEVANLEVEVGEYDRSNIALREENAALEKSNIDLGSKADLLDEVEENLFEKEQEVSELQNALNTSRQALTDCRAESEKEIQKLSDKSEAATLEMKRLEAEMAQQAEEAEGAISQWEGRCSTFERELSVLQEIDVDGMKLQISTLQEHSAAQQAILDEVNANLQIEKENVASLMNEKTEAEALFQNHIQELESAIQEHVAVNEELQTQLDDREDATAQAEQQIQALTDALEETRAESEQVVTQWQTNGQQLEETIVELEATIERQTAEATSAIAQWEERCNALGEQVTSLESEGLFETVQVLQKQLEEKETELFQAKAESRKVVEKERATTMKIQGLEMDKDTLENSLRMEKERHNLTNQSMLAISNTRDEMMAELASRERELSDKMATLGEEIAAKELLSREMQSLSTQLEMYKNDVTNKQREKETLAGNLTCAEDEKKRLEDAVHNGENEIMELKMFVGQLEVELQEANDALQSHLTDEVTIRATEKAVAALRTQIKDMREKQVFDNQALMNEKSARISAEEEIERLKADLKILAKIEQTSENNDGQVQKMTSRASAEIMQKERHEIEMLRQSLDEMIGELKSSKFREREAEDRAANSRMHASVCEQELLAAKADVDFLKQSLDNTKKDGSEMQCLLQNRIHALESDRQNMLNRKKADVEVLKVELSNIVIERDQLIHALNESEKANSTLVYSTTIDNEGEDLQSMQAEIAKLKLENAQLLSEASKSASRLERRIKNALAGDASEVEAEIEGEKRRCEDAEQNLSAMKEQYDKVMKDLEGMKMVNSQLAAKLQELSASNLEEDVKRLGASLDAAEREKVDLLTKLNETESTAKTDIAKLEDKCKLAEAKIRELERVERKEAALAAEIAKLQEENMASKQSNIDTLQSYDDSERKGDEMDPGDQLDHIRELQAEISQERTMYSDLLTEHEDLLALLAQTDCEKKCLQQALANVEGSDAVEKVISEAEDIIVGQFGKYVAYK